MRTRSVAVLVTSACLLAVAVVYVTRDMLRLDGRKYRCMVLKQDVRLIDPVSGRDVGSLGRGVALYAPNQSDMDMSDPGDIELHKVFIRVPVEMDEDMEFIPSLKPREVDVIYSVPSVKPLAGKWKSEEVVNRQATQIARQLGTNCSR